MHADAAPPGRRPPEEPHEAPEAPPHWNNTEAAAWQSGWESGFRAALRGGPSTGAAAPSKEWCMKMAEREGDSFMPAGAAPMPSGERADATPVVPLAPEERTAFAAWLDAMEAKSPDAVAVGRLLLAESAHARAEVAALREALEDYGDHHISCSERQVFDHKTKTWSPGCVCGFERALAGSPTEPKEG